MSADQPDQPANEEDDLALSEATLLRLGADIPDPTKAESAQVRYPALIATRARSLYQNFLHSLDGPTAIGPLLAIRPLVEAAILLKWISLDPELHGDLWFAQSDDRELTAIREQQKHLGLYAEGSVESVVLQTIAEKVAARDDSVAKGKAAGKRYGDRPTARPSPHGRGDRAGRTRPQDGDAPELRRGLPHVQSVAAHGSGILQLPPRLTRTTAVSSATSRRTRSNT